VPPLGLGGPQTCDEWVLQLVHWPAACRVVAISGATRSASVCGRVTFHAHIFRATSHELEGPGLASSAGHQL